MIRCGPAVLVLALPSELMTAYPVAPKMNKASFNTPEAIAPTPTRDALVMQLLSHHYPVLVIRSVSFVRTGRGQGDRRAPEAL